MKKLINTILHFSLIFLSFLVFGQKPSILRDSVCHNNNCYKLQELKLPAKDSNIYKKIQSTYNIFEGFFFENPTERLKAKKNNLISLITKDILQESQYGFESYHLLYNNNGIFNLSVKLQYYGSPWEDTKYFCFDTNADKEIGKALFVNQSKLLQIINKKLRSEESKSFIFKDLSTYKINANNKGKITSISFVFFDLNDRMNSGYPQYLVSFDWDEIQKYISPKYKNILSNK